MQHRDMVALAYEEGFCAAEIIAAEDIIFNEAFRKYCEDNVCGFYGANYSCPPDCGTFEEMKARLTAHKRVLVVQTKWRIADYTDKEAIWSAKHAHNSAMFRIIDRLEAEGYNGLMGGASCCTLCKKCAAVDHAPCTCPGKRFSCLSAYCIDVKALAERCGMEYFCADGSIAFFGIYAF